MLQHMDHVIGFNSTTAFAVLMQAVEGSVLAKVGYYVNSVLMMIMTVGFGGYQANVIQLAIDQLHIMMLQQLKLNHSLPGMYGQLLVVECSSIKF